jgi:hypothetical protein
MLYFFNKITSFNRYIFNNIFLIILYKPNMQQVDVIYHLKA